MVENQISLFYMYLELSFIPSMIVETFGSLVQRVILAFSLVILQIPVLAESIIVRSKKIMETMNVTFDELSVMAFEQSSSKPGLQSIDLLDKSVQDSILLMLRQQ
ncbi:hypothetical protein Tco_0488360 [Tanacetum coccineum]